MYTTTVFGENNGLQAGSINGPVHVEFHQQLPPEHIETPPNPSAVIPFEKDADFVGRGTILDQLCDKGRLLSLRTALVGLGGAGKSQLAIEFAYCTREQAPETWIFWVHASNTARFEQSYNEIANRVKIAGRHQPQANVCQLVYNWLCDERNGRWVLILDNLDDASFLFNYPSHDQLQVQEDYLSSTIDARPLGSYLPRCPHGSMLITTRSQKAALQLVEPRDIVEIGPMSEVEALALLDKKLGELYDDSSTLELAAALEFMPLALVQCAAYISQRAPRCSVQQYLKEFQKSDSKRARLLDWEGGQVRRDLEAKNSIMITWQISFDHIREVRPSAADLLSLMSFFDRQGIPEALLQRRQETVSHQVTRTDSRDNNLWRETIDNDDSSTDDEQSTTSHDELEDDIAMLRSYSFVAATTTGAGLEMHRLVQLATQKWLETHGQHERWKQHFVSNLSAGFPNGAYGTWKNCQRLFPHVKLAAAKKPRDKESLMEWASLLNRAVLYCLHTGNWVDAEKMSAPSLKVRKRVLRADHPDTLTSMANLASTYRNQGRWKEAEELEVQVKEIRRRVLGEEHPSTLTSMANLASTYRNQGRWKEAEELEVQVKEISLRVLGEEHPDTLTSMANLASTYWNQGRWKEAEELFVQVKEISLRVLGEEHPSTLTSMANLASTYSNQGRWKEAEELEVQVKEIRRRVLGEEHPSTLTSMNNLAHTQKQRGQFNDALVQLLTCLQLCNKVLGPTHPNTQTVAATLQSWQEELELNAIKRTITAPTAFSEE